MELGAPEPGSSGAVATILSHDKEDAAIPVAFNLAESVGLGALAAQAEGVRGRGVRRAEP